MAATITTLIMGNAQIDFVYTHIIDNNEFVLDTRQLKADAQDQSLTDPELIHHLTQSIRNSLKQLASNRGKSEVKGENHA
jgi:hypothetical protein